MRETYSDEWQAFLQLNQPTALSPFYVEQAAILLARAVYSLTWVKSPDPPDYQRTPPCLPDLLKQQTTRGLANSTKDREI